MAFSPRKLFRPWDANDAPSSLCLPDGESIIERISCSSAASLPLPSPIYSLNLWTSLFLTKNHSLTNDHIFAPHGPFFTRVHPFSAGCPGTALLSNHQSCLSLSISNGSVQSPTVSFNGSLSSLTTNSRLGHKPSRRQRPKRFRCPHCQIAFSNNGQLKGHIRTHTGERPFTCDHSNCGKTFTRNEELTRHRRIHTGIRPYSCPVCGKRFGRKDHLKKHQRTHERRITFNLNSTLSPSTSDPFFASGFN